MLRSWLTDLAVEQADKDGVVPIFVPFPAIAPDDFPPLQAEAGWGDAAVIVPWTLYQRHGDAQILADQWDSMTAWLAAFEARAGEGLDFPGGGFMFGDWLDTSAPPDDPGAARTPWPCVATAYLARSAQIMAEAAEILGRPDDRDRYADLANRAAERFRREYVTPNGRLAFAAQTAYALALEFDLSPTRTAVTGRPPARRSGLGRWFSHRHRLPRHPVRLRCAHRSGRGCDRVRAAAAAREPVLALSRHDGRHDDLGAVGLDAPRRVHQSRRHDLVQPLRVRRGRRLAAPHGRGI